jgi:hypothetical protein
MCDDSLTTYKWIFSFMHIVFEKCSRFRVSSNIIKKKILIQTNLLNILDNHPFYKKSSIYEAR